MAASKMIKVDHAYLHQSLQAPGFPAEKTVSLAKFPGGKFYRDDSVLYIEHKGKRASIPLATVASMLEAAE